MDKVLDTRYEYMGFWNGKSVCHLRVYEAPDAPTVVILTELPENEGTSITNMIEHLATQVYEMLERPARGVIWIENYPPGKGIHGRETWDRVTFREGPPRFGGITWQRMERAEVEVLIGQPLESVSAEA